MSEVKGTMLLQGLKRRGGDYMFGIIGFPLQPVALAAQEFHWHS